MMIRRRLLKVYTLLLSFSISVHAQEESPINTTSSEATGRGFFDALTSTFHSLVTSVGVPQLDPLRLLEKGPEEKCPIVITKLGKVVGIAEYSRSKVVFFSYLGIPYGKSPSGVLRFEPPQPFDEEWGNIKEVKQFPSPCLQFDWYQAGGVKGAEDCLTLSVATRKVDPKKLAPVIVHIHGGPGMSGSSKEYHPRYFMDHNVVFVTMNYRLGALGFLNTVDGPIKGNMGLKDQQLALKWVKDNIKFFGGDPKHVTLSGDGFGAVCAHLHVLSDSSKDLFQKAILQSGSALSPWGFNYDAKGQYDDFAEFFNCPNDDDEQWVHCMKKLDAQEIVEVHVGIESPLNTDRQMFLPTVEPMGEGAVITRSPYAILESGKYQHVPMIIGVNEAEGTIAAARIEAHDEIQKTLEISWDTYMPIILRYPAEFRNVSKRLKTQYLQNGLVDPTEDLAPIMQMVTDANYLYPTHLMLNYHRFYNPKLYFYWYSYKGQFKTYSNLKNFHKANFVKGSLSVASTQVMDFMSSFVGLGSKQDLWGPGFGDQIFSLFYFSTATEIVQGSKDFDFSKGFVKCFVDFASDTKELKLSNAKWIPVTKAGPIKAMAIDRLPEMIDEPFLSILPLYDGLHIRDPPAGIHPPAGYIAV